MNLDKTLSSNQSLKIPNFIYGTAWKEERTADLVALALESGFRAIDTANQRKHYFEEAVGQAFQKFIRERDIPREDLFIQTKFTFLNGQDHRLPYDSKAPYSDQVKQSLESSLRHFGISQLDSFLLHGPFSAGLRDEDFQVWTEMENRLQAKETRTIGVSNFNFSQLKELCSKVAIKPRFVQNRCFAIGGWDKQVRDLCKSEGISYQGFSLLTANQRELQSPLIIDLATKYRKTVPQIVFRFSHQIGIIPITGTSSRSHIETDLSIFDFELSPTELEKIENISL